MKKSMIKRSINAILCFAMLLGNFSIPGFAADADASLALEPEKRTISMTADLDLELPENEELFAGFVERELYGYEMNTFGTLAREQLNAAEQGLYDALKPKIETVAANGGSTAFSLSDVSGLKTKWTNTELGVTDIVDIQMVVSAFFGQFDIDNIMTALLSDCPFDLYWFDKTSSAYFGYRYVAEEGNDGAQAVVQSVTISDFEIGFSVAEDYKSDEYMVTTDVAKITTARNNAPQVVANNAGKSDTEKLAAYKDYICNAVSYNHAAADNNNTPYGDPWQLIHVFDGDSSTNVVCEGYSKAFQYLCDLTSFEDDTLCYSVSGWMDGGGHMWNIVTLDGKNYLVDVTNSDAGSVGQDGSLFLAGGSGSVAGGYVVSGNSYVYDDQTKALWGADDVLALAAEDYTPETPGVHIHSFVSGVCACGAVEISETTFPDANFRAFVLGQSYGTDGVLTKDELSGVTSFYVRSQNIQDLTGIEYFTALEELSCFSNRLTSLDVSGCTALTELNCDSNKLTSLDISGCAALRKLECRNNQLTSLDVSNCKMLETLFCARNSRTVSVVKNQFDLSTLEGFAVSKASNWQGGTVSGNILTATADTVTYTYDLGNGQTATFTLVIDGFCDHTGDSHTENASEPTCGTAGYTGDTVCECGKIIEEGEIIPATGEHNYTTEVEGSRKPATCKETGSVTMKCECGAAQDQTLPVDSENHNYVSDVCADCGTIKISEVTFPDDIFRAYVEEQDYGTDGLLTQTELNGVTYLHVSGKKIKDLTGINYFTALSILYCSGNKLIDLDVSKCPELSTLYCDGNQLTSLDVSSCIKLKDFSCSDNQLTSLDVSKCTGLIYMYCSDNQLTSLDVSNCTELVNLGVDGNRLTSLDVSNCTELMNLTCSYNQLTDVDLKNCTELKSFACNNNRLTSLDVSECMALKNLSCAQNQLTSLDISNCKTLSYLVCYGNSRTISVVKNQFNLNTLDGFDVSKASDWYGGTVNGSVLTVTSDEVVYAYDLGNGETTIFYLVIEGACEHNWKEATCTEPKTCAACGATEGTTIPHVYDQKVEDAKYLVSEGVYYKSCLCGAAGEETFTVAEQNPSGFKDVPKEEYYYDAAMWAVEKGVTKGTGDGSTFEPNAICTRGQVVTFLWRAAGQPEPVKTENPFKDVKSSEYYYKAVLWAAENGITTGTKNGDTFEPDAKCNRAQIVTFLSRAENGQASGNSNPFKDVKSDDYFYEAVLWAVENEITTGTKDGTTFEPNTNCSRAQVITFLWRAYNK